MLVSAQENEGLDCVRAALFFCTEQQDQVLYRSILNRYTEQQNSGVSSVSDEQQQQVTLKVAQRTQNNSENSSENSVAVRKCAIRIEAVDRSRIEGGTAS